MRLLNVYTLELEDFTGQFVPSYCILSHRWGADEVSYKEYRKGFKRDGAGYRKIVDFCAFVRGRSSHFYPGLASGESRYRLLQEKRPDENLRLMEWVWIDTCCIDKRSSSELTEAINSMYQWYESACECYVLLSDVATSSIPAPWENSSFRNSSWFKRGWTLQELLAPQIVVFCNASWEVIGHQHRLNFASDLFESGPYDKLLGPSRLTEISDITQIPAVFLNGEMKLREASIAQRMSWAAGRQTTRVEDEAYSLLGIFNVNMPLLYGEGPRAFLRLQEEILRRSTDQSVLDWSMHITRTQAYPVLADGPHRFAVRDHEQEIRDLSIQKFVVTNKGLELRARLYTGGPKQSEMLVPRKLYALSLNYSRTGGESVRIYLMKLREPDVFGRAWVPQGDHISEYPWEVLPEQVIYLMLGSEL